MQTKAIVEGALLTGITVILVFLGSILPFIGIIAPLPLIILSVRWETKVSIMSSLLVAVILGILMNPMMLVISLLSTGLIGVSMGAAFEEDFSPKAIVMVGTIATVVSLLLILAVNTYILDIDIFKEIEGIFDLSSDIYKQLGVSEQYMTQFNQIFSQLINLIKVVFPALFLLVGLFTAVINYYFSVKILDRIGYNYKFFFSLRKLRYSKYLAVIYILFRLLLSLSKEEILIVFIQNSLIIINFMILFEGLAVVYSYFVKKKVKNSLIILIVIFFLPFVSQIFFIIGFFDLWIDFRKLDKS
ncbi:DUF2232 domain-containing protein [Orenia marismortui]|uniref:DUF2232 domain-containing protein n=1 Tax=Orenia marismortui TaxID=46469 RepID=UPI00035E0462|nr:DUF2232 domain-containing protein [Orenia marismortui]